MPNIYLEKIALNVLTRNILAAPGKFDTTALHAAGMLRSPDKFHRGIVTAPRTSIIPYFRKLREGGADVTINTLPPSLNTSGQPVQTRIKRPPTQLQQGPDVPSMSISDKVNRYKVENGIPFSSTPGPRIKGKTSVPIQVNTLQKGPDLTGKSIGEKFNAYKDKVSTLVGDIYGRRHVGTTSAGWVNNHLDDTGIQHANFKSTVTSPNPGEVGKRALEFHKGSDSKAVTRGMRGMVLRHEGHEVLERPETIKPILWPSIQMEGSLGPTSGGRVHKKIFGKESLSFPVGNHFSLGVLGREQNDVHHFLSHDTAAKVPYQDIKPAIHKDLDRMKDRMVALRNKTGESKLLKSITGVGYGEGKLTPAQLKTLREHPSVNGVHYVPD